MRRWLPALAALALAAAPVGAAQLDRGDLRLELTGELRNIFTFGKDLDPENLFLEGFTRRRDAGLLLTRARLDAQAVWRDRVYGQLTYDNEVFTGSGLHGLQFAVAERIGARTWLDADRTYSEHSDAVWRHSLYRAWLRVEGERYEVTVGRQRIPLGRGRLWNPIDLFNPIFPLAVEADQRIGVDAARARLKLARGLWVEGIWSPQDDPDDHRAAVRLELSRVEVDAALTAGRFRRDWVFGLDFAANLRGAAVRGEATFSDLEAGGRIWQVSTGADYTFGIGNGLYALIEHLYNENRISTSATLPAPSGPLSVESGTALVAFSQISALDRITTTSLHQTGVSLSYDLTPILRIDGTWLYDWNGPSVAFVPALTWAARSDLELSIAGQLFWGPRGRSEYGDVPGLLILRMDAFF